LANTQLHENDHILTIVIQPRKLETECKLRMNMPLPNDELNGYEQPIGQPAAIAFLEAAIAANRIAPAYLFAGTDGIGRAIAARYFARKLLGDRHQLINHPDLLWVQPTYLHNSQLYTALEAEEKGLKRKTSPQIRLEQIREISRFLSKPPLEASRSIVVLEQAETMGEGAANGLLKTLEEPGRATLILIAPSVESLLPTLVSRCQRIPFYRLSPENLAQVLHDRGLTEILNNPAIISAAQGSPGAAIAAWEQLQNIPSELLARLVRLPGTLREALGLAKEITHALDTPDQLWLIDYLQNFYWQSGAVDRNQRLIRIIEKLETARRQLRAFVQPRLVWEVMLMAVVQAP